MPSLSAADYERLLDQTTRLHACADPQQLPRLAIDAGRALVGVDRVTFEHIAPTVEELWGIADPPMSYEPARWRTFLAHIHEHPAVNHYWRTGDCAPLKISDFISARRWQRTGLYQELYRGLACEDQMAFTLNPPGREFYAMVFHKGRWGFAERDRLVLNRLRRHVRLAFGHARALQRTLEAPPELNAAREACVVHLDARGRLVEPSRTARTLLRRYFGAPRRSPAQLPEPLRRWLRHARQTPQARTYVQHRGDTALIVRLFHEFSSRRRNSSLLLEVRRSDTSAAPTSPTLAALTPRERQVLRQLEQGKTNTQIAKALFISPATVKKHFENIYDKLGVRSRVEVLAVLRREQG